MTVALGAFSAYSKNEEGGYLFATFQNELSPDGEQVYFGLSRDGRRWDALNGGLPVLRSEIGEKGLRDPYLLRSPDGESFFLLATDLSIYRNPDWIRAVRYASRSIAIFESKDLVHWSPPRLIELAVEGAGCAWAPEAVYDHERGEYLVFWASTTKDDDFSKHRIWARWTKDFRRFSDAFVYIERPFHVIDTTIVHDGTQYIRFTKDESLKSISMEMSPSVMGVWEENENFSLSQVSGYEGPLCFRLDSGQRGANPEWCLMLDRYVDKTGYDVFLSDDIKRGKFEYREGFGFPFHFRHGSVLALTALEYERLKEGF